MRRAALALGLVLALGACQRREAAPQLSCPDLRSAFDNAFAEAVEAGAHKRWEEQKRHVRQGERAVLAMEEQGCCRERGACPALGLQ